MAVDEALNSRLRARLAAVDGISEKKMMGGTCFLLNGNMIGGADRTREGLGRFMFRVGKDNHDRGAALPGAEPMVQGGRRMTGFFFVPEGACGDKDLDAWFDLALGHAASLPPK